MHQTQVLLGGRPEVSYDLGREQHARYRGRARLDALRRLRNSLIFDDDRCKDRDAATVGRVDRSFATFATGREDGYDVHRLVVLGVEFRLFVGRHVPASLDELCFARTGRVVVRTSDLFAREIGPHLLASPPKGKLAKRG